MSRWRVPGQWCIAGGRRGDSRLHVQRHTRMQPSDRSLLRFLPERERISTGAVDIPTRKSISTLGSLQDINKQSGYEGRHIFSIHSKKDQIVGHLVCQKVSHIYDWHLKAVWRLPYFPAYSSKNSRWKAVSGPSFQITSQIPGQMGEKVFEDLNHDDTFHNSHSIQLEMIRNHVVVWVVHIFLFIS